MRDKIANNLRNILKNDFEENDGIFCADWDLNRIGFEESILGNIYHSNREMYQDILDRSCEGTGYFLENITCCEVMIVKI